MVSKAEKLVFNNGLVRYLVSVFLQSRKLRPGYSRQVLPVAQSSASSASLNRRVQTAGRSSFG